MSPISFVETTTPAEPKLKGMKFSSGVQCLTNAIDAAREQGKSTRLEIIDQLMRSDPDFKYFWASSVQKVDGSGHFSSFGKFVIAAEETGKVKTSVIEGFPELFLSNEDPKLESEFGPEAPVQIERKHWKVFFDKVEQAFKEGKPGPLYGHFMFVFKYIRMAKKDGTLPYPNRILNEALSKIVELGILLKQTDSTLKLCEDFSSHREAYINKLVGVSEDNNRK